MALRAFNEAMIELGMQLAALAALDAAKEKR